MAWGDGISRMNSFSLTDFHDFDFCPFKFYVKHHLDKKYEIEEGNEAQALGTLLDVSIKKFHDSNAYGQRADYLINIIKAACSEMKERVEKSFGKPSFYSGIYKFLNEELIKKTDEVFVDYYEKRGGKINKSLGSVGFCEWVIKAEGQVFKLWGGPDALELGDDGIPEVVDYKSRQNIEKGKEWMDMDLMPKIYTLLVAKTLIAKGFSRARFKVRFWQDPLDESFTEEFDLHEMEEIEELFKEKIEKIFEITEIRFCEKRFCRACQSPERDEYLRQLNKLGLTSLQ